LCGVENAPTWNPICCCATQGVSASKVTISGILVTAMLQATPMSMHLLEIAVSRLGGIHTIFYKSFVIILRLGVPYHKKVITF